MKNPDAPHVPLRMQVCVFVHACACLWMRVCVCMYVRVWVCVMSACVCAQQAIIYRGTAATPFCVYIIIVLTWIIFRQARHYLAISTKRTEHSLSVSAGSIEPVKANIKWHWRICVMLALCSLVHLYVMWRALMWHSMNTLSICDPLVKRCFRAAMTFKFFPLH